MDLLILIILICAVISVTSSLMVVLTLVLFPRMRTKTFMSIVAYISIGDIIGNFPYLFPYRPGTGNWWCSAQAFMNLAGYPMGWMWTVVLVYFLYLLGARGEIPRNLNTQHAACWSIPVVVALSTRIFTKYSGPHGADVCSVNTTPLPVAYHIISYFGLLLVCLVVIAAYFLKLHWLYRAEDPNVSSVAFRKAKATLQLYPLVMVIFWLPHLVTEFLLLLGFAKYAWFLGIYYIFVILKELHGTAAALIFFVKSREARLLWYEVFFGRLLHGGEEGVDDHDSDAIIKQRMKDIASVRMTSDEIVLSYNAMFDSVSDYHHLGEL